MIRPIAIVFCSMLFLFMSSVILAETPKHPWVYGQIKADSESYFTNIKNGDVVESPVVIKFGMRNQGISPAGYPVDIPRTGHHHLLIDMPLPLEIQAPIPFSNRYMHFGKGQMEAILNLEPGKHTVRLLLANHKHVPYFVFSDEIKFTVTRDNPNKLPADYGKKPRLEILNIQNGANLPQLFLMQFHASGLNIAPAETKMKGTGYFKVRFTHTDQSKEAPVDIAFPDGKTEAWFKPPVGSYKAQLFFVRNPDNVVEDVTSEPVTFSNKAHIPLLLN